MVSKFQPKKSAAAEWCYRLALFALLFFVVVTVLHRFGLVSTTQMFWLITAGLIMVATSIILAFKAVSDLWNKGYKGGSKTIRGILLSSAMLLPFVYYAYLGLTLPLLNDVSTDVFNPPEYITVQDYRDQHFEEGIAELSSYGPEYGEEIVLSYPRLAARRYPAGEARVYKAVIETIKAQGWKITAQENEPTEDADKEADQSAGAVLDGGTETSQEAEATEDAQPDIEIEAEATTLIMGYKSDVVIRISDENDYTLVNMRSASRWGRHDFGDNARQIERFMDALDGNLLGILGEGSS